MGFEKRFCNFRWGRGVTFYNLELMIITEPFPKEVASLKLADCELWVRVLTKTKSSQTLLHPTTLKVFLINSWNEATQLNWRQTVKKDNFPDKNEVTLWHAEKSNELVTIKDKNVPKFNFKLSHSLQSPPHPHQLRAYTHWHWETR